MTLKQFGKPTLMVILASALASFPIFFAAPIMLAVRKAYSGLFFWLSFVTVVLILAAVGLFDLAIVVLGLSLLVGIFYELEVKINNMFIAGLSAVLVSVAVTVATTQHWLATKGINLVAQLKSSLDLIIKQAGSSVSPEAVERIIQGAPSVVLILFITTLFSAILLERLTINVFRLGVSVKQRNLLGFKLPDVFIWIAMISFLFSFINTNDKTTTVVAANVFNVVFMIYFLQGLAVVESLFRFWRLGFFTRLLTYVVFLVQLFPVIALVGVVDYWAEFRNRFNKKKLAKI